MRLIDPSATDYDAVWRDFRWQIPEYFNIGVAVSDAHVDRKNDIALYWEHENGDTRQYTFGDLIRDSNRLANVLQSLGVRRGDRVAIVLPQRVEAGLSHLAIYKLGAVALPLASLFREDAVEYRLQDSGSCLVITDAAHKDMVESLKDSLPELKHVIDVDGKGPQDLPALMSQASDRFEPVKTRANDPHI